MNMRKVLVILGLAAAMTATIPAQATTVSYTRSLEPDPQETNFSSQLNLPQFDSALGSLNSVLIQVQGSLLANAGIENTHPLATGGTRFDIQLIQNLAVTLGDQTILAMDHENAHDLDYTAYDMGYFQRMQVQSLSGYDGVTDFGGSSGLTVNLWDVHQAGSFTPSSLGEFIGTETFAIQVQASAWAGSITGSNFVTFMSSLAGTTATVTYDYSVLPPHVPPVPEPLTLISAFMALGGLGTYVRRRTRSAPAL